MTIAVDKCITYGVQGTEEDDGGDGEGERDLFVNGG
jgi:hypothetical protein